jgi:antitoxin (DNA-binding transcriptional repressor) of toxin-antitoxin stability system
MKASIVELRKNMKSVTRALARNEDVILLSHGVEVATMIPVARSHPKKNRTKASLHPFFGSAVSEAEAVDKVVDSLRSPRYAL